MPLTAKGKKIKKAMVETYGKKKGEQVFYASENKGTIKGVAKGARPGKVTDSRPMGQVKPMPAPKRTKDGWK